MITSGRPEFLDLVWPLITHENDQIHLAALRAGERFRPSLLGTEAAKRLSALSPEVKKNVLHEIAFNSGMDGLDLATSIARDDRDLKVKAMVVDALTFRRANRHIAELLKNANDELFDRIAAEGFIDKVPDDSVQTRLEAARERQRKSCRTTHDRLRSIVYSQNHEDRSAEVVEIVGEMEIDPKSHGSMHFLHGLRERYPRAVAEGLLTRVRQGRPMFYGADNILAAQGLSLEDDALVEIALAETHRHDDRAEAAASILGPQAVGRMIEACFEAKNRVRDISGKYDQAAGDRYFALLARIGHTPGASLLAAVQARAMSADSEEIPVLADLLSRRSAREDDGARPFNTDALPAIGVLVQGWGERMLAQGDRAKRWQIAALATLVSRAPSVALLPLLKRLLDDNLQRFRAFRAQAIASGWRSSPARDEATHPHTFEYREAFLSIKGPETAALMEDYLDDEHFGQVAATVLASQWSEANEPKGDRRFRPSVDFSRLEERRAFRAANPAATSSEAEAIFRVIDGLIADGSTDEQNKLAVSLGIVAARLPHGRRETTIGKLIVLASRGVRADLLLNLVLSGEEIDLEVVTAGIAETFEAAKTEKWLLTQSDGYELRRWLLLLPFTNRPSDGLAVVQGMPEAQRTPRFLEEMLSAFSYAPSGEAEDVLFRLADGDARFYANHSWRDAVLRRGTKSAARRFIDRAAQGVFNAKSIDDRETARQIGGLMEEHPELRAHVYDLLKNGPQSTGLALLARAVAENPDANGLLLLIGFEARQKRSYVSWRTIEGVVTENVPSEDWKGAYYTQPVEAAELRKVLFAMTTNGGADDLAARCLNRVDKIRDDHGAPESEPRHPDLASGRPWPIMMPDPDAEESH